MDGGGRRWTHGPSFEKDGIVFRIWAPAQERVSLALEGRSSPIPMERREDGYFETFVERIGEGALYRFELADGTRVPDPASRFQPRDGHGPSETIDHDAYRWRERWQGIAWDDVVLYELHIGAFTPEGSFAAAARKLDHLVELGVTAVEVMPVGDFRGRWGWGHDGVYPYAPDASYGRPEDFKSFVEAAHRRGVAVLLDVVYNHFGPEGNYLSSYAPGFCHPAPSDAMGRGRQFRRPRRAPVRDFIAENAEFWIDAFSLDGLRIDAAHSIKDDSRPDIIDELAARLRSRFDRPIHLLIENENNEPERLVRRGREPLLYTAQWNVDAHHVLRAAATEEKNGYYADHGETELLGRALAGVVRPGAAPWLSFR
jgi:maltooligosyltrehalose trehalohydrolase